MQNIVKLHKFIEGVAEKALLLQQKDGSFPCGKNGPWGVMDTPVRNTAHWMQTFAYIYETNKKDKYFEVALLALNYILNKADKNNIGEYICRQGNLQSNGLVGQGWIIESFITMYMFDKK